MHNVTRKEKKENKFKLLTLTPKANHPPSRHIRKLIDLYYILIICTPFTFFYVCTVR